MKQSKVKPTINKDENTNVLDSKKKPQITPRGEALAEIIMLELYEDSEDDD